MLLQRRVIWSPCAQASKACDPLKRFALEGQRDAVGGEVVGPRARDVAGQCLERRLAGGCVLANKAQEGNL